MQHMESPASSTLLGEAAAPPQPAIPVSFLFPPVPSRDWRPYGLALRGLQQWTPGSPQPLSSGSHSTWGETQR